MSKGQKIFLVVLLVLVAISGGFVLGSSAKYTTVLQNKTGTAVVATWAFESENNANALKTFAINLTTTISDSSLLDSGKIAPGTAGNFAIQLNNQNSDVGIKFTIAFDDTDNVPANLIFKSGSTAFDPSTATITGYIARGETLSVPISWEWDYYNNSTDDGEDTTDGINHYTMTVTAKVSGEQTNPNTTVTTGGITVIP